ncbi:MAG TPA: aquaporin [Myxococcota bacterium]|nr:aquaporin [Myxococcota bacterium]
MTLSLGKRACAEALASAFLLAAIVGSGIMGERLAGGNAALALLANSAATGAALVALILAFAPISGAQLNPAVTLVAAWERALPWREVPAYVSGQLAGALAGVGAANAMFALPVFSISSHARSGAGQLLSESLATFGLIFVVQSCARLRDATAVALAVGGYIAAAYWFTSSTSFANPAVTIARTLSDTFAGIRPADAPGFIAAQAVGAFAAASAARWLAK